MHLPPQYSGMPFFITLGHWLDDEAFGHSIIDSLSLSHVAFLLWRDGESYSQATNITPLSLSVLTFPSRLDDICSFDVNIELSLSQRPFQEVTSGSLVPSSGPNGEDRVPELIDYPHPTLNSHRWYKTWDLAAGNPLQFNSRALKGNTPRLKAWLGPLL